ncbi:MAG: hypothetical protein H0X24_23740 [Ktedonobacterales bacterium]|nr:hypothetical protein [Ktedonobacterales bacterium]
MRDPLTWIVAYPDGATLAEYAPDGSEHGWAEVRANAVAILALQDAMGQLVVIVEVPTGHTAEFFRRRTISLTIEGGQEVQRSSVTYLGWDGAYLCVYEDGSVALRPHKD